MRRLQLIFVFLIGIMAGSVWLTIPEAGASGNGTLVDGYWAYPGYPGLYWHGNNAYTRTWVSNGYGGGYYQYSYSYTYAAPPTYKDPNWRNKLLDIAAQRDKAEAAIRTNALEQRYFLDAVKALGLEGNFHWNGYGQAVPYGGPGNYAGGHGGYGNLQLSTAGVQGNTVYGYSMNSIASFYGDANLGQLYQQAARLADGAQKLAGQATSDFSGLIGQEGANRAKVAEILAKGQAVQEYLRALQGNGGSVTTKIYSYKVAPGPNGAPLVEKVDAPPMPPAVDLSKAWEAHAVAKCASCHAGQNLKGGFDVTKYRTLTPEQKLGVVSRLVTTDATKLMPRNKDGGPGPRLSAQEVQLWLAN